MKALLTFSRCEGVRELAVGDSPHVPRHRGSIWSLYTSNLRVLSLGYCKIDDQEIQELHFPLLTQLDLLWVDITKRSVQSLLAACPILDSLKMESCSGLRSLRIRSYTLRIMVVDNGKSGETGLERMVIENAPSLELLHHLRKADLNLQVLYAPRLENIGYTSSTMLFFGPTTQGSSLTAVSAAITTLALYIEDVDPDIVTVLLKRFPCLENPKIFLPTCSVDHRKNDWNFKEQKPLDTPVKAIEVYFYDGEELATSVTLFFVTNAASLESMTLHVSAPNEKPCAEQTRILWPEERTPERPKIHLARTKGYTNLFSTDAFVLFPTRRSVYYRGTIL